MERGGTGYIPDCAKENYGKDLSRAGEQRENFRKSLAISLPHPDSIKRPSTAGEAEKMFSMSLQWAEEEGRCLSHADAGVLQGIFSTILTKVKVRGKRKVMDMKLMSQAKDVGRGRGNRGSSLSKKY